MRLRRRLPDLRGRVLIHQGQGPGLSNRNQGSKAGQETVALSTSNLASHDHTVPDGTMRASASPADSSDPTGNSLGLAAAYQTSAPTVDMAANTVTTPDNTGNTGSDQAHANMPPFLTVNVCIALAGIFPSRN